MLAHSTGRLVSLEEQEQVANGVLSDLSKWGPGEWPARPAVLTWDDGQIVDAHRKNEHGGKLTKDERAQLSFFGSWRGAIFKMEADNAGKIQVLLRVANFLEHAERWEDLEQLQQFARDWYHLPLPRSDIPQNPTWQVKICERYSQNRALLPVWLRGMTRPPPGHETAGGPAPAKAGPPSPQASLAFVPEDETGT
jgi:hypothetical protein